MEPEREVTIIMLHRFDSGELVRIEVGAIRDIQPLSKDPKLGSIVYIYGGKRIHVQETKDRADQIVVLGRQVEERGIN